MHTNIQYANSEKTTIRCDINGVASFVPCDPSNGDYARILELVAGGALSIAPFAQPPVLPVTSVTMRQARLALLAAGRLDDVEAAIAQGDRAAQIEWEYATVIERGSSLVATISAGLGLNDAAIDELFENAAGF